MTIIVDKLHTQIYITSIANSSATQVVDAARINTPLICQDERSCFSVAKDPAQ